MKVLTQFLNNCKDLHYILECSDKITEYIKDKYSLTRHQYNIILFVYRAGSIVSVQDVTDHMNNTFLSTRTTLQDLTIEGFVIRTSPDFYTITSKGRFVLDDIIKQFALILNT